jgi:hypothetical protein
MKQITLRKNVTFQKNPQTPRCENLKPDKNNKVWEDYNDVKVTTARNKRDNVYIQQKSMRIS